MQCVEQVIKKPQVKPNTGKYKVSDMKDRRFD